MWMILMALVVLGLLVVVAMPPEEKGVLERYRQQFGEMGKAKTRDVKGKTSRMQQQQDLQAGHRQGRDAQLHQAMGADKYKQIGA